MQEGFERRQQQGQRSAQLMTDIRKKPALGFVQLLELLVAGLQHLLVLTQFVTQGKFTKTNLVVKPTARDNEHASHQQEIKVIKEYARRRLRPARPMEPASAQVSHDGKYK